MTDLIERLRTAGADYIGACYPDGSPDQAKLLDVGYEHGGLHHVAADEIERLERELADMTAEASAWRANARDSGEEARKYKHDLAEARGLLRMFSGAPNKYGRAIDAFLTRTDQPTDD